MSVPLLQTVLGLCFVLVWAFVGATMLRHSQVALRRRREMASD